MNGEHKPVESRTEDPMTRPRNCGLIARDLTLACHEAWSKGNFYSSTYLLDSHPKVKAAEAAVVDRISDLEQQVEKQLKIIARMQEISERLEREVSLAIQGMKS